jgi:hypothetical protein
MKPIGSTNMVFDVKAVDAVVFDGYHTLVVLHSGVVLRTHAHEYEKLSQAKKDHAALFLGEKVCEVSE